MEIDQLHNIYQPDNMIIDNYNEDLDKILKDFKNIKINYQNTKTGLERLFIKKNPYKITKNVLYNNVFYSNEKLIKNKKNKNKYINTYYNLVSYLNNNNNNNIIEIYNDSSLNVFKNKELEVDIDIMNNYNNILIDSNQFDLFDNKLAEVIKILNRNNIYKNNIISLKNSLTYSFPFKYLLFIKIIVLYLKPYINENIQSSLKYIYFILINI